MPDQPDIPENHFLAPGPSEPDSISTTIAETPLPYPVGRAVPLAPHIEEARNKAKLNVGHNDVDPASLF
jgi:hypothetical protein